MKIKYNYVFLLQKFTKLNPGYDWILPNTIISTFLAANPIQIDISFSFREHELGADLDLLRRNKRHFHDGIVRQGHRSAPSGQVEDARHHPLFEEVLQLARFCLVVFGQEVLAADETVLRGEPVVTADRIRPFAAHVLPFHWKTVKSKHATKLAASSHICNTFY